MQDNVFQQKEIEMTADGSATIYLPLLDEHYHSVKGAYTESVHIFLNCGLLHCPKTSIRVLEVGFGTGLNAVVTACGCGDRHVDYFTLERYPLSPETIEQTGYYLTLPDNESSVLRKIHLCPWEQLTPVTDHFAIAKLECDLTSPLTRLPDNIDVVYFDAFAPEKQPEMWSDDVFRRIFDTMAPGGILTTYCAKGEIRRRLQSTGFTVERLPGPPNGKREILRATKPMQPAFPTRQ